MIKELAAGYARCSDKQGDVKTNVFEIKKCAERMSFEVVEIYSDLGTGRNMKRAGLQRLLKDCDSDKFSVIVIPSMSRLARSLQDLLYLLKLIIEEKKKKIYFIKESMFVDLKNPFSKLLIQILGAFAEFMADLIAMNREAGIARAKAEGKHLGRNETVLPEKSMMQQRHNLVPVYRIWQNVLKDGFKVSYNTVARRIKKLEGV